MKWVFGPISELLKNHKAAKAGSYFSIFFSCNILIFFQKAENTQVGHLIHCRMSCNLMWCTHTSLDSGVVGQLLPQLGHFLHFVQLGLGCPNYKTTKISFAKDFWSDLAPQGGSEHATWSSSIFLNKIIKKQF